MATLVFKATCSCDFLTDAVRSFLLTVCERYPKRVEGLHRCELIVVI